VFALQSETEEHMRKFHGFSTWSGMMFFAFYHGESWESVHTRDHNRMQPSLKHYHDDDNKVVTGEDGTG
jgi:hypothetical protein